jgi:uncharacterized protein involved in type VI secretion and phage assembly
MSDSGMRNNGGQRFYGKYRGMVLDNVDPDRLGRITAQVADVFGDLPSGWALPSLPATSLESGMFAVPGIGSSVWIEFEQGDPEFPIWSGGFWLDPATVPTMSALGPPTQMVFQTTLGNLLVLDDEEGGITLQTGVGHSIRINAAGITLMSASGAMLMLSAEGLVELSNGGGASVTMEENMVAVNGGALMVT